MATKKRVIIGMSGGVDSSVAAALLKRRGYDVIGITMQLLEQDSERKSACCNLGAIDDAKRVCAKLGIPHYTINSRTPFKTHVIDTFVSTYLSGQTPNPCVECNRYIKFDELWNQGKDLGADYVATGHYCRKTYSPKTKKYRLKTGKDSTKDQSYFLYMLQNPQLKHILFPLGGYQKAEIRKIAEQLNLINARKKESQEICFVTQKSYKTYIKEKLGDSVHKKGFITDTNGTILGDHTGIFQFTIGQRKGLNIASQTPKFVLKIDPATNTVVVGDKSELKQSDIQLHTFTLVDPDEAIVGKTFQVKTRYQMTSTPAKVTGYNNGQATLNMAHSPDFISPGQSTVLYDADRIVGGGIIAQNPL